MSSWLSPQQYWQHPALHFVQQSCHLAQYPARPNYAQLSERLPGDWRFVAEAQLSLKQLNALTRLGYEQFIYQHQLIPSRANWHDFFNALIWVQFPQSKIKLNQLHADQISLHGKQRNHIRDRLTHWDECGLILAISDSQLPLLEALRQHQWQQVFVEQAAVWGKGIAAYHFGHANLEMHLAPFLGMTGKWIAVRVKDDFYDLTASAQCAQLDHLLVEKLSDETLWQNKLPPLPFAGIPGWWPGQDSQFYANQSVFRPRRAGHSK